MKFFKCIPSEHHAVVAADKCRGERYAIYEGMINGFHRRVGLGEEKNGWFVGCELGRVVLSNCRDITWIASSHCISHLWHVDRAGTTIIVESGGGMRLIFADGVMVVFNYEDDFDRIHNWGHPYVYYDSNGLLLHYVFDNPSGRLLIFNINELHLLASILAKSYQWNDYKPGKQLASKSCRSSIAQADCPKEMTWACLANP